MMYHCPVVLISKVTIEGLSTSSHQEMTAAETTTSHKGATDSIVAPGHGQSSIFPRSGVKRSTPEGSAC